MTFSVEQQVLLWACSLDTDTSAPEWLSNHLDWSKILYEAMRHKILPMLYWRVQQLPEEVLHTIPPNILEQMQLDFCLHVSHQADIYHVLRIICALFSQNHIPCLVYKGPACAGLLYDNTMLRPFADLDLLIPQNYRDLAEKILIQHGFDFFAATGWVRDQFYSNHHWQYSYNRLLVELHWELSEKPLNIPLDCLWNMQQSLEIQDITIASFSLPALVLSLCIHAKEHCWNRLLWIADIVRWIAKASLEDWDMAFDCAQRATTEKTLGLGFCLAQHFFHVAIPEPYQTKIRGLRLQELQKKVQDEIWNHDPTFFHKFKLNFTLAETWPTRLQYLVRILEPTVSEYEMLPMPQFAYPLYYLLRPIRLGAKGLEWIYDKVK